MVAIIYSTVENMECANKIAQKLLEEKLVACVNIIPNVHSIYRWKGNIEEENECIIIAKTVDEQVKEAISRIKDLHTYELPDIIVLPIIGGSKQYLDYLVEETQ
jgi:periplasmic divalent cation tolerance protein